MRTLTAALDYDVRLRATRRLLAELAAGGLLFGSLGVVGLLPGDRGVFMRVQAALILAVALNILLLLALILHITRSSRPGRDGSVNRSELWRYRALVLVLLLLPAVLPVLVLGRGLDGTDAH